MTKETLYFVPCMECMKNYREDLPMITEEDFRSGEYQAWTCAECSEEKKFWSIHQVVKGDTNKEMWIDTYCPCIGKCTCIEMKCTRCNADAFQPKKSAGKYVCYYCRRFNGIPHPVFPKPWLTEDEALVIKERRKIDKALVIQRTAMKKENKKKPVKNNNVSKRIKKEEMSIQK
jgi:hypothetical protein